MRTIKITGEYAVKVSNLTRSGKINASLVDADGRPICGKTFFSDVTDDFIIDWAIKKITPPEISGIIAMFLHGAAFDEAHDKELKSYLDSLDDDEDDDGSVADRTYEEREEK